MWTMTPAEIRAYASELRRMADALEADAPAFGAAVPLEERIRATSRLCGRFQQHGERTTAFSRRMVRESLASAARSAAGGLGKRRK